MIVTSVSIIPCWLISAPNCGCRKSVLYNPLETQVNNLHTNLGFMGFFITFLEATKKPQHDKEKTIKLGSIYLSVDLPSVHN
jgi:hypothetical protein